MKKLYTLLAILSFAFVSPALANYDPQHHADVEVSVNGLVCDFCARALEKVFGKQEEVESINVDLDAKIISVYFKEGLSLDDEVISELITDSGYDVQGIQRHE